MLKPDAFANKVAALCRAGEHFGNRQWTMATGGNFSARLLDGTFLITRSGVDKGSLSGDRLMVCNASGAPLDNSLQPSAETPLHALLYRLMPQVGSVLHTHSITTTVLSRSTQSDLSMSGFEMQKSLSGVSSHDQQVCLPVFENTQDMTILASQVERRFSSTESLPPGFLVRGHGLYAWGDSIAQAVRHVEGFEFLCSCLWQEHLARPHEN